MSAEDSGLGWCLQCAEEGDVLVQKETVNLGGERLVETLQADEGGGLPGEKVEEDVREENRLHYSQESCRQEDPLQR